MLPRTQKMQFWQLTKICSQQAKKILNCQTTFCWVRNCWKETMNFSKTNLFSSKCSSGHVEPSFDRPFENVSPEWDIFLLRKSRRQNSVNFLRKSTVFLKLFLRACKLWFSQTCRRIVTRIPNNFCSFNRKFYS